MALRKKIFRVLHFETCRSLPHFKTHRMNLEQRRKKTVSGPYLCNSCDEQIIVLNFHFQEFTPQDKPKHFDSASWMS